MGHSQFSRRQFLRATGAAAGSAAAGMMLARCGMRPPVEPSSWNGVAIQFDPADPVATSAPAQWAIRQLQESLAARGCPVRVQGAPPQPGELAVRVAELAPTPGSFTKTPDWSENFALDWSHAPGGAKQLVAAGSDPIGLAYALCDLTDRVRLGPDARFALDSAAAGQGRPANPIRSIMRLFANDLEDKPWFYDRDFWPRYFDMLVTNRFNRFNLALGLSYDFSRNLTDVYFFFAYPFLVNVPGYNVRAVGRDGQPVGDGEQRKNLEMLHYASDLAAERGLHFQLGLWTHNYLWTNSPNANYTISGLTPETQAPYCRDALHRVLEACPGIKGITLRTHGESGIPEGSYDLWKIIMSGITGLKNADGAPRIVELDMHAKTMTQEMIDTAHTTGMPVVLSPKFWAEHMGLPYIQASIRPQEMPRATNATGLMALSSGSRSFLRYGLGDLLRVDRNYRILHRVWPGTQRLLLWGDPLFARGYGECFHFGGTDGVEFFDPLSFKGRGGSGLPPAVPDAGRSGYADAALLQGCGGAQDWRKYDYTYRLLGRLLYDPGASPEVWQRQLRHDFGPAAAHLETALAHAGRILPLITTAHDPSAANNNYWPEIYVNMSLYDATRVGSYGEAPSPRIFANVTSLDPEIFGAISDHAEALLAGKPFPKVTPLEVATQLAAWSAAAITALQKAMEEIPDRHAPAFRRAWIDVRIQCGIGGFFAEKIRAATCLALFDRTGYEPARREALLGYKRARDAWAALCDFAAPAYARDLTFGPARNLRGHWSDRLADIDRDIADLPTRATQVQQALAAAGNAQRALGEALRPAARPGWRIDHTPPAAFQRGRAIPLSIGASVPAAVRLKYRHINQGERYRVAESPAGSASLASFTIPPDYTDSPFPLEYFFELESHGQSLRYPHFREHFTGQPYFVIDQAT